MARSRWLEALNRIHTPEFSEADVHILSKNYRGICAFIGLEKDTHYSGGLITLKHCLQRRAIFEEFRVAERFSYFLHALRKLSRRDYLIWKAFYLWHFTLAEIHREFIQSRRCVSICTNAESIASRRLKKIRSKLAAFLRSSSKCYSFIEKVKVYDIINYDGCMRYKISRAEPQLLPSPPKR